MAESMVGIVVGIVVLAIIATLLSHQLRLRREHHVHHIRDGTSGRYDGHRWWERLRHRH